MKAKNQHVSDIQYKFLSCLLLVHVTLRSTASKTARPEECGVAGLVAVWFALMLSVATRGQRFVALLAAQTGAVPVLPQGRLSLSEIDRFLALWAVGHDGWGTKRTKALRNPSPTSAHYGYE